MKSKILTISRKTLSLKLDHKHYNDESLFLFDEFYLMVQCTGLNDAIDLLKFESKYLCKFFDFLSSDYFYTMWMRENKFSPKYFRQHHEYVVFLADWQKKNFCVGLTHVFISFDDHQVLKDFLEI